MMDITPDIVQVVPHEDYTVSVFFCDGKTVLYDVKPKLVGARSPISRAA